MKLFNTIHSKWLNKGLQINNKKHKAISKNISNVNNPNYEKKSTNFADELTIAEENTGLNSTDNEHITQHTYDWGPIPRDNREGKVNLTKQMTEMAENQIKQRFSTVRLRRYYQGLGKSIKGKIG